MPNLHPDYDTVIISGGTPARPPSFAQSIGRCERVTWDKTVPLSTFIHWTDPDARRERTVFGAEKPGLFYNYDDRLYGESLLKGEEIAKAAGIQPKTAMWYQAILNHFHQTDTVDLQHIILGCNQSNGFSYLIFGYTYDSSAGT